MLVAEHDGPTMFARIGMMRALNRPVQTGVRPIAQGQALGTPEAGARPMTEAGSYRGFRSLWRAKFADKPCRNRWQLQRINLITFQAPKRARPFAVNRHHQHHQAAAVLASPR
jgi:hypothetical protein